MDDVTGGLPAERWTPRTGRWGRPVTAVLVVLAVLLVGFASASPPTGVTSTILGRGQLQGKLRIATKGPTDFVFQEVRIEPGGHTGWHSHPGTLLVVVKSGTLTRVVADCLAHTYTAGQAFVETTGVHEGQNLDPSTPVELLVTYVNPGPSPLRIEANPPSCAMNRGG